MEHMIHQGLPVANLLDAYSKDPTIRDRLNAKGLYINFQEDSVVVNYYLTELIDSSTEYQEFIEILSVLQPEDTVFMFIDNGGGYLSGAAIIGTAIQHTQAYTIAVVLDTAASAATIVALECDEININPHAYFMLHAASFGSGYAKLHENQAFMEFHIGHTKRYLRDVYKEILEPEEIERLIKGEDFYFTAEEVMRDLIKYLRFAKSQFKLNRLRTPKLRLNS